MKKCIGILFVGFVLLSVCKAQESSMVVLGDLHYDLIDDHDMDWLKTKPDDLRQVTEEYTVFTRKHWNDLMTVVRARLLTVSPPSKAIIQLGDLSQGLAGSEEKAQQMAANTMKAILDAEMPVPWILAKGNHDITGPGAVAAFNEHYLPMIRQQTGNPRIESASYSYQYDGVHITVLDPWDKNVDINAFLENELAGTSAKVKFVVVHEPVIPVTERCWHLFRRDTKKREALLDIIAKNKAIVLCGHLHRYAVVSRQTNFGPVVQVMVNSVVRDRGHHFPTAIVSEYGSSIAAAKPDWQPETLEARKAILDEEGRHIDYYVQTDLPGYAILKINEERGTVLLEYYAAFHDVPFDCVDLTKFSQ